MVKSRLQHRDAHSRGHSCVAWDKAGKHVITSGADGKVLVHSWDPEVPPSVRTTLKPHNAAITCVLVSPNGTVLATASVDHSVKLYSYPDGAYQSTVTRFTLPIRALAFSSSGYLLAAAGDDDSIKLVNTVDNSITRIMKGHRAPVISLAFDPRNEYLASVDSDGTLMLWIISSGKLLHSVQAAPRVDVDAGLKNTVAWHPEGRLLAVPGLRNNISFLDRDTAEEMANLTGGHTNLVSTLAWSPNGKYLASAGLDKQIVLWDVEKKEDVEGMVFETEISCIAWKPIENGLALINIEGKFSVWESAVPPQMISPTVGAVESCANIEDLGAFSEEEESRGIALGSQDTASANAGDGAQESDDEDSGFPARKRTKKARNSLSLDAVYEKKISKSKPIEIAGGLTNQVQAPTMQRPFQPGSTSKVEGKRWFLAYNLFGSISSFEKDGSCHVEVEFHDITRGARIPAMTDYFGFTMASLSEKGCVLASPQKGEKSPSTLMYRPFNSWASNSEWSIRFPPNEDVKAVATGDGWVAVVTSLHLLRLFSEGGLQRFVLSLSGPVVSMAAHEQLLVVAYQTSAPLSSGDQCMDFVLLDLQRQDKAAWGRLALSPSANLSWLGFSDSGSLGSYDSQGVLRQYSRQYGGCWVPIFSAEKERNSSTESFWMVGFDDKQVFAVICKLPDTQPLVFPRPVLRIFHHSLPLVKSDFGGDDLENDYLRHTLLLSEARTKADQAALEGLDVEQEDDKIIEMEIEHDRYVLRLIAAACKGDKLVRALELATFLTLPSSMQGAVKLVNAMRLPALAERLNLLLEKRLLGKDSDSHLNEATTTVSAKNNASEMRRPFKASESHQKEASPAGTERRHVPGEKPRTFKDINTLSTSTPVQKAAAAESTPVEDFPDKLTPIILKTSKKAAMAAGTEPKVTNPFAKSSGPSQDTAGEPISATRKSSNPFAKQSNSAAGSSGSKPSLPLLDSLKVLQNGKRKERE